MEKLLITVNRLKYLTRLSKAAFVRWLTAGWTPRRHQMVQTVAAVGTWVCSRRSKRSLLHNSEKAVLFLLNARLFMFADVNICKSRCWARADWGPLGGLEEALFTCSEECCPAWTLLYLSGTRGSQRRQRWAALSLSKVSTSQYQQRSTMWATWEEEMEFLLVLLRRSQTHSQCPLVPLIPLSWAEGSGERQQGHVVYFGGAFSAGCWWS